MNEPWSRQLRLLALISLGFALCVLAVLMQRYWREVSLDIAVYWEAGERMRSGGALLYKPPTDPLNDVGRFIYPPTFAVLFAPLTLLPRWLGYAVWGLVQLGMIALSLNALAKLCRVHERHRVDFWLLLLLTVFGAAWETLREGQVNFIVLASISHGLWRISSGRQLEGGIWLALAAHLKVIPAVLLAVLLAQRRWRAAVGMTLGLCLFYFAPLFWTVPALGVSEGIAHNHSLALQYFDEVAGPRVKRQEASNVGGPRAPNCALSAVSQRFFYKDVRLGLQTEKRGPLLFEAENALTRWSGFGFAALMYAGALLLAALRRDTLGFAAASGLALSAATLGNVLCWPHHLASLGLVVGPLASLALAQPRYLARAIGVVCAVVLLCFVTLLPEFELLQIWGLPTLGALIAWGVCFMTFWRRHESTA
jgi:Glycosyltransferase family 87